MSATATPDHDVIVVGAGFSGLYMLHRLRQQGRSVHLYEAGSQVGGTWYWNRYPGARCDVQSWDYSYSFDAELEQEWDWSERYATQPEIQRYLDHVADRFALKEDITFDATVVSVTWDDVAALWTLTLQDGSSATARHVVAAVGCLSTPRTPEYPGQAEFTGRILHTGHWPDEEVDFTGKRVAVIGTGSSGIQAIPLIAQQADQTYVLQRTPNFSVPAWNGELTDERRQELKDGAPARRARARSTFGGVDFALGEINSRSALELTEEERREVFEERWRFGGTGFMMSFGDLLVSEEANETAAEFVRDKIRGIVEDPAVADLLSPRTYPLGAKRLAVDTDYYATFNRDDVELIDLNAQAIETFTETGVQLAGRHLDVDVIVTATGYDAMTGSLLRLGVTGRDGLPLEEAWKGGPETYLGLAIAGFPNFFVLAGPGSPSVLTNMPMAIEQHVDWTADLLEHVFAEDIAEVEATPQAQTEWVQHVNEVADATLFGRANSWYVGANVPGKARVFMPYAGGLEPYQVRLDEVAADRAYTGLELRRR